MTNVLERIRGVIRELDAVVDTLDPVALEAIAELFASERRVHFAGVGRSGLAARAIAMRLMHLGCTVFVVGETTSPGITHGDALIVVSASGRGSALAQIATARAAGAVVAAITTSAHGELASLATVVVEIPVRQSVPTSQHAGSLFEQSVLVVGDALCAAVQERLGVTDADLDRRHANLL